MRNIFPIYLYALLFLGLFRVESAHAAPPPLEDFFRRNQFKYFSLSPDTKHLAISLPAGNEFDISVIDLADLATTHVAHFEYADADFFRWINNDRLVMHCNSRNESTCYFGVNRDGTNSVKLEPEIDKLVTVLNDDSQNVLIAQHFHTYLRAHIVSAATGKKLHEVPLNFLGLATGLVTDNAGKVRFLYSVKDKRTSFLWYRENPQAKWEKIAELDHINPAFWILGFDSDDRTLYVTSRNGQDKYAIYKFDLEKKALGEEVLRVPDTDVGCCLIYRPRDYKVVGAQVDSDPPKAYWFDTNYAKAQEEIDATFPDHINRLIGDVEANLIVYSYSATDPGRLGTYNFQTKKYVQLFEARPWLKSDKLVDKMLFDYTARDGLNIPSYLTFPKGKPEKSMPLIVLVHNGPFSRNEWSYDASVQFLASRGYVVLQPQFRGSTGRGWAHYKSGWGAWGGGMQDDLDDGVNNLVAQGLVDPKRVCIMGTGYGGYAALMGAMKNQALYRCAIDLFGRGDVSMTTPAGDPPWYEIEFSKKWDDLLGDYGKLEARFNAMNPLLHAETINSPTLIVDWERNGRYIKSTGQHIYEAMKDEKKKDVEWLPISRPYGELEPRPLFTKEEEEIDFKIFKAVEAFLEKYNPANQESRK